MPRILIVDDQPEIVRGLEDNLCFEGYQTTSATNGEDALALAMSDAPDLVLLDLMLPRMSGWDVCRELRRKGIDVPVIMLTARGAEVDRVLGLELGADDYVTKPFSLRELLARSRALIRRRTMDTLHPVRRQDHRFAFEGWLFDERARVLTSPAGEVV